MDEARRNRASDGPSQSEASELLSAGDAAWPGHKAACKARVKEREEATKVRFANPPSSSQQ